jgi:hypothetical protein
VTPVTKLVVPGLDPGTYFTALRIGGFDCRVKPGNNAVEITHNEREADGPTGPIRANPR